MTSSDDPDAPGLNDEQMPVVVARSRVDVLAAIAVSLGYQPHRQLVLAASVRGIMGPLVTKPIGDPPASQSDWAALLAATASQLRAMPVTRVFVVGYGAADAMDPAVRAARAALKNAGITVPDTLRVTGDRYFVYPAANWHLPSAEGVRFDLSSSTVMVRAVLAGRVTLPNPDALRATIAPVTGDAAAAAALHAAATAAERGFALARTHGVAGVVREATAALRAAAACYRDGGRLDDDGIAWLGLNVLAEPMHNQVLDGIGRREPWHVALWTDVTRRCLRDLVAAPAAFLAFAAWQNDLSPLARVAVRRSLEVDPVLPLAQYMRQVLAAGISPDDYRRSRGTG